MINLTKQEINNFNIIDMNFEQAWFDNIQWQYQDCNENSLLVLNLANDKSFIDKHLSKLIRMKPRIILTNSSELYKKTESTFNSICATEESFLKLRSMICDKKFKINKIKKSLVLLEQMVRHLLLTIWYK